MAAIPATTRFYWIYVAKMALSTPFVDSDFGSAGKNSKPPSTLLFYTLMTCGFVAKKVGLVGGTQFFTALPKTAVSQYEKRLHNFGLMDKCGRSPNITVRLWSLSPTSRSHMV